MPAVSVIIPFYNVEAYLDECLASLLVQEFQDWEAILIDDGSTDTSRAVAQAACEVDERFRLIVQQKNRGQSAARNVGLDHAQGDYILFLDSDDRYAPGALGRLISYAREHQLDCLDFSAGTFYEAGAQHGYVDDYQGRTSIPGVHTGPELFCRYQELREYYCSPCMHVIQRDLLERAQLRFLEGYTHEDELFSPLLHAAATRAAFLNEELYERRVRPDSTMTTQRGMRNITCMFTMAQKLYAWLLEHGGSYSQAFQDAVAQRVFELREIAARDAATMVDETELVAYAETLSRTDRIDFDMHVIQAAAGMHRTYDEVRASRSYQLGSALLAIPRALKDALSGDTVQRQL